MNAPRKQGQPLKPRERLSGRALAHELRQMIAVLEDERQALASLDADALICASRAKDEQCRLLETVEPGLLDSETRPLAQTARQLNEVNRQVRNLLAANVAARLEALGRGAGGSAGGNAGRLPSGRYGEARYSHDPRFFYSSAI